jgi:hypothetical protein
MSNVINNGRQWPAVAVQDFDFSDLDVAPSAISLKLPVNAIVLRGGVIVEAAFGVGAALAVGVAGVTTKYASAVDLNTTAFVPFTTGLNTVLASGETVILTPDAEAIAATVGRGKVILEYIISGRATENQP